MQINQINVNYIPAEDRLLMRINTVDKAELRFWLTRRITATVLGALTRFERQALTGVDRARYVNLAEEDIKQLNRQTKVNPGDFSARFNVAAATYPMGEAPVLVTAVDAPATGNGARIMLGLAIGQTLTMELDPPLLHGLLTLVERAATEAAWGVITAPGDALEIAAAPDSPRPVH